MSEAEPRSRKRHVGIALLAKSSCRSASDPITAIRTAKLCLVAVFGPSLNQPIAQIANENDSY
jgi:hypothetical protein